MIKKGTRKTRHEARQRWGCNRCGHTFTNPVTMHSLYPVKVIMEVICRYNLGYSARETVRYLTCRFHISSQYPVILEADVIRKDNSATKLAALAL